MKTPHFTFFKLSSRMIKTVKTFCCTKKYIHTLGQIYSYKNFIRSSHSIALLMSFDSCCLCPPYSFSLAGFFCRLWSPRHSKFPICWDNFICFFVSLFKFPVQFFLFLFSFPNPVRHVSLEIWPPMEQAHSSLVRTMPASYPLVVTRAYPGIN